MQFVFGTDAFTTGFGCGQDMGYFSEQIDTNKLNKLHACLLFLHSALRSSSFACYLRASSALSLAMAVALCAAGESDSQHGRTALIWAAMRSNADCVRLLIDAGADKEAKYIVRRRSLSLLTCLSV